MSVRPLPRVSLGETPTSPPPPSGLKKTGTSAVMERPVLPGAEPVANILIVDDTPANLLALEAILEPLGHNLVRAQSGEEALKHVLETEFAVILMDVQMPAMDGFQTAVMIKERDRSRHVPIIFITAISRDAEHVFQGYEHGAVDYLLKPFDPYILCCKISVFVELYHKGEEIRRQAERLREHERAAAERDRLFEVERGARRMAEATLRAREEILAVVSHELRSPLNAIFAGAAVLTRSSPAGEGGAAREGPVHAIERSAERMDRLISDLLDVCRIEGSRLAIDPREHAVLGLVSQATETLQLLAGQKRQKLVVHVNPAVVAARTPWSLTCDKDRVHQVLLNLVGNAVKFSKEESSITLSVSENAGFVRFAVKDEGPGIRSEELPHIFDRYWQSSLAGARQGLGLGLAIAKGIVDAHGGRIWAESVLGAGTTFYFELPEGGP